MDYVPVEAEMLLCVEGWGGSVLADPTRLSVGVRSFEDIHVVDCRGWAALCRPSNPVVIEPFSRKRLRLSEKRLTTSGACHQLRFLPD
jgi:hypothetical protein